MKCCAFSMTEGSKVYSEFRYPAGEMQVRLTDVGAEMVREASEIQVTAMVRSGDDIVRLALLRSAIGGGIGPDTATVLILPYLPYARADRRFVKGDCFGLATFSDLVQAMGFNQVVTLDAHSKESCEQFFDPCTCATYLINVSPLPLIERAVARFAGINDVSGLTVLFPDEGAAQRYLLPETVGNNGGGVRIQALYCTKKRDPKTSALSGFNVPKPNDFAWDHALIVDDICDGGGTFIGIADALAGHGLKLGLYVTHGIFSKGFGELKKRFTRIYTTDSMDHRFTHEDCHTFEAGALMATAIGESK